MIHVYLLPEQMSNGYCFRRPVPIVFGNVDWFESTMPDGSAIPRNLLEEEVKKKKYFKREKKYLVIGGEHCFTIGGEDDTV